MKNSFARFASLLLFSSVALGIIFLRFEGGVGWVVDIEEGRGRVVV
jgi:hypothetical protein